MTVKLSGIKISEAVLKQFPDFKNGFTVTVGVASGTKSFNGQSMGDIATWNEYGNSKIPARPFMAITTFKNADQWGGKFRYILKQSGYKVMPALEDFGDMIVGQVKQQINAVMSPPLSPYTIKRKGTDKPLIDTGFMMNSIVYQIEKK